MKFLLVALGISLCCPALACACSSTTSTQNTMAIQSPCVDTIVTNNQVTTPFVTNAAVSDTNMFINGGATFPVMVQAPGMLNVEVRLHGVLAKQLTSDGVGGFSGTVNTLTGDPAGWCQPVACEGPLTMQIDGWNSAPGDNSYTVHLVATFIVWNHTGNWYPLSSLNPVGAQGLHLAWRERFGDLEGTSCKPGTGTWPNCAAPSATDINPTTGKPYLYYLNMPEGGNFGDAAFEAMDGTHNPFNTVGPSGTMLAGQSGFLRIRATHDPNYVDPYGFNRHWYGALISTMFPDRSSNVPQMTNGGYCEIRAMTPIAYGTVGANNGGGTWPAFWSLSRSLDGTANGDFEWDVGEWYGDDPFYTQAAQHTYSPVTGPNAPLFEGHPDGQIAGDFHRYGLRWSATSVQAYFDDKPIGTALQAPTIPGGAATDPFWMIDMDMGGGWNKAIPPAGYFDFWIDDWECYVP